MDARRHTGRLHLLGMLIIALATGCGGEKGTVDSPPRIRTEDMSRGQVRIRFLIEPERVRYDTDTLLTIALDVPSQFDVTVPELLDRVQGFTLQGTYSSDVVEARGRKQWEVHARLTPNVSQTHRIAPMALEVTDHGHSPPESTWLATRPVVLAVAPLLGETPDKIRADLQPAWIAPSFWTVAAWAAIILGVAVLIWAAFKLGTRLHREAVLRRLSPRERAMREMEALLRKHLLEKDRIKEFYLELTMIVRRYIERAHGIRAPEQTTEEFLVAVRDDARFSPAVVERLRSFLEAADLVKFAAHRPDRQAVDTATRTAQQYVEADAAEAAAQEASSPEGGT